MEGWIEAARGYRWDGSVVRKAVNTAAKDRHDERSKNWDDLWISGSRWSQVSVMVSG